MEIIDLLSTSVPSVDVPPTDCTLLKEQEELLFQNWLAKHPDEDADLTRKRLEYLRAYILQYPDYDGEDFFVSDEAFCHYANRKEKIKATFLSEEEFYNHSIIQQAINDLGLNAEPTFDFILYLWFILKKWIENGKSERVADRIKRMMKRMEQNPDAEISVDFKVGPKHFCFTNSDFIKVLVNNFEKSGLLAGCLIEKVRVPKREADYILIKTLLDQLPISQSQKKKGNFSQAERNFALSVLWLTGELNHRKSDDPAQLCTNENNATFDKLMRDFRNHPTPPMFDGL